MKVETGYEVEKSSNSLESVWREASYQKEFVTNVKDECEMKLVGGKAFNISVLARKGFTVPEGFCITTRAYDYFMDFNNILAENEEISDKIREGSIPPHLAEVIADSYEEYLKGKPCAVRSSSPAEDLRNASFAGQYESLLNVRGVEALLGAVKQCWASLWGRPAVEYRKKMGISENVSMAVLVQEMIPAATSGVLFTQNHMVIEGVWGLGDVLVGGKVFPDHFVVEREKFRVKERKISRKQVMSQISPLGGTEKTDIPENLKDAPVLEDVFIQKLCVLGNEVEKLFGCPQDIEWALCNDIFVLLQARPISEKQAPTIWSRANLGEMQPGYVTYLSRVPERGPDFFWNTLAPLLECFDIKEDTEQLKLTEYIYGYIYVNMTATCTVLSKIPGLSVELINQAAGYPGAAGGEASESKLGFPTLLKLLPGTLKVIRFFLNLPTETEQVISQSLELIEDTKCRNLQEMSPEELDDLVWEMYDGNSKAVQVRACTILATTVLLNILKRTLKKVGEENAEILLTMGLEGMSSSQVGVEMWKLAQSAKKSSKVSELILSRSGDTLETLNQFPEGEAFLGEMAEFLKCFGDRCSQELELSVPRWEENPKFVLSMVANYLGTEDSNPAQAIKEQKNIRVQAADRILRKLSKNPVEKMIFRKVLKKMHEYIVARESLKTALIRGVSAMKILYLVIAEKLANEGMLENTDDIFYLKMTEVSDIIAGTLRKEQFKDFIRERREEKILCENLDVPNIIMGMPPPIEELKCTVEPRAQLEGVGCSQGVVTGRAKIVRDPSECPEIKEGEILVTSVTDPGWSPLLVTAGGLVVELGGTLSHGIIIAREYGIPAVTRVENATRIIKPGQLITVDGGRGIIYIKE
ncbi:MAG: hypothetical protein HXS46_13980 [Theionarchaea archaeon]|nr:hypothetical protein [Theionarchaea archaeon]